mgnify:CR=1
MFAVLEGMFELSLRSFNNKIVT